MMGAGAGIPDPGSTAFLAVDLQERLLPVIAGREQVTANCSILNRAAEILGLPLVLTEQYPQGLGRTVDEVYLPEGVTRVEKTSFSCFDSETFNRVFPELGVDSIVIFGVEAHVCILKTALAGVGGGYEVHVVADAIGSRREDNRRLAVERMRQSGVYIVSTEMILFQLIEDSGATEFKQISRLIR